jgi:hypothetical protein
LRSYFNSLVIYVKFYFINLSFSNKSYPLNVLSLFETNYITLSPDFYSQNNPVSKIQYQNILMSLEEGTGKLINNILLVLDILYSHNPIESILTSSDAKSSSVSTMPSIPTR